jgi:hypothetical protein
MLVLFSPKCGSRQSNLSEAENCPNDNSCFRPLNGKFLSTEQMINFIMSEEPVLKEIPRTIKENVYFLLDNSHNVDRRTQSKRMEFWDNCGTWDSKSTSTKTKYFIRKEADKFISIIKKNNMLCKESK